uniref:ATP synthase subunit a n=1 Tax=Xenomystus nigri TaxID=112162 RepID=C4IX97_XENNI|nr:ATP synthase F0 subunit 6 [Xenomystus nigri]BAH58979.1 ATPase subunits 6 [Xenomystus nigri]BAJ54264.1 ATPase subunits 6 [Xenomystus nigri]
MTLSFFDQFSLTTYLGVPMIVLALTLPWALFLAPKNQCSHSRLTALQYWFVRLFTHQLFVPMNKGGHKWALVLISLLVFLMSLNLLGILPYTFTPTTQLSMNLGLAIPLWMATVLIGLRNQPTHTFAHLLPISTPTPLIPILIVIETISLFIRPIALGVRLTANLTAGHLLIQLISTATFVMTYMAPTASVLTMIILILLTVLELAVAFIQAYVFVLLLSLYLEESV